jgi:hypothetical protein
LREELQQNSCTENYITDLVEIEFTYISTYAIHVQIREGLRLQRPPGYKIYRAVLETTFWTFTSFKNNSSFKLVIDLLKTNNVNIQTEI